LTQTAAEAANLYFCAITFVSLNPDDVLIFALSRNLPSTFAHFLPTPFLSSPKQKWFAWRDAPARFVAVQVGFLFPPARETARISIPLADDASKSGQTRAGPGNRSLAEFLNPPLHSAFCSVR
jgi:hypothetical protein